jgi:hypothetical protein
LDLEYPFDVISTNQVISYPINIYMQMHAKEKKDKENRSSLSLYIHFSVGKLQFTPMKLSPICNSTTNVSILLIAPH